MVPISRQSPTSDFEHSGQWIIYLIIIVPIIIYYIIKHFKRKNNMKLIKYSIIKTASLIFFKFIERFKY